MWYLHSEILIITLTLTKRRTVYLQVITQSLSFSLKRCSVSAFCQCHDSHVEVLLKHWQYEKADKHEAHMCVIYDVRKQQLSCKMIFFLTWRPGTSSSVRHKREKPRKQRKHSPTKPNRNLLQRFVIHVYD